MSSADRRSNARTTIGTYATADTLVVGVSLLHASRHHEPCPRVFPREARLFCFRPNFKACRFDRFYFPPLGEGSSQLVLGYPSLSLGSWRLIAEAKQEQVSARLQHSPQAVHVLSPVFIRKNVKQT